MQIPPHTRPPHTCGGVNADTPPTHAQSRAYVCVLLLSASRGVKKETETRRGGGRGGQGGVEVSVV
jgi:hypothetical protein